jgi:hypothetical protein
MSPLAVELVRRVSWFAVFLALALLAVPRVLTELGVWGPSSVDRIAAAERTLATARAYGGGEEDAAYRTAAGHIVEARALLARGEERRAGKAARRASEAAIEAQRAALGVRESRRRQASLAAIEIDRLMNDLEDLYAQVSPGTDKETASRLLSTMKEARRKGASVLLAVEEGEYARAIGQEAAARETLEAARRQLEARRPPGATRPQAAGAGLPGAPPRSP